MQTRCALDLVESKVVRAHGRASAIVATRVVEGHVDLERTRP